MKKITKIVRDYYLIFCVYALIGWLYEVFWMWFVVPPKHFINRGVLLGPFLPIYGNGMIILLLILRKLISKKHEINKPLYFIPTSIAITTFIYTTIIEYTTPKIYHVSDYIKGYGLGLLIANIIVLIGGYLMIKLTKNKKIKELDTTIILVFIAIWVITTGIEYISHYVTEKYFHMMLWNYAKDFLNINRRVNWDASRNFAIGGTFLLYTVQPLLEKTILKWKENKKTIIALVIGIPMLLDLIFHVLLKLI